MMNEGNEHYCLLQIDHVPRPWRTRNLVRKIREGREGIIQKHHEVGNDNNCKTKDREAKRVQKVT